MKARDLIKQGRIGKVKEFYIYMAQDWNGPTWRGIPELCGGGQINDSGSHYQDIILWMLDELPVSAEGFIDNYYRGKKLKVEANGSFNVELTNGITGRIIILSDYPGREIPYGGFVDEVRIIGDKGAIYFRGSKIFTYDYASKAEYEEPLTRPENYPDSPVDNFVKMLRKKVRINRVPFIFGSRVALFTEAMLRSGHEGGKKIMCEKILKECGHKLEDLRNENI
jgi:predicted dehydrogenase